MMNRYELRTRRALACGREGIPPVFPVPLSTCPAKAEEVEMVEQEASELSLFLFQVELLIRLL